MELNQFEIVHIESVGEGEERVAQLHLGHPTHDHILGGTILIPWSKEIFDQVLKDTGLTTAFDTSTITW